MLEKVLDFQKTKTSMFLTDTSEDIDAHFWYIASKKKIYFFRSGHPYSTPLPLAPPATSPAPSVTPSMWERLKIACPLEWMATGPLPTVPMTYPFQSQSTPDLTNSLLIPVGIYMFSITCSLILITSPAAILNLFMNSLCPLHNPGINLRWFPISFPLHSSLLPVPRHPGCSYPKLPGGAIFTVCSHTLILLWLRKTFVIVKTFQLNYHLFTCALHSEISSFFGRGFLFLFLF